MSRRQLGQAEVEELYLSALRDEDVGRLDVAMDDAVLVRGVERVGDLDAEVEDLVGLERPADDEPVLQRFAFHQLHDDEGLPVRLVDVVDRADVRVLERGSGPRLALEALERLRVPRDVLGKELQSDVAPQARVLGAVDDAHAAAAQLLDDPVAGDRLADHRAKTTCSGAAEQSNSERV